MDDWGTKPWQTYAERAIKFRKSIGAETHPVISRDKHPQQWREWYVYYGWRGMFASQDMMRQKDEKTVPTISPFDFDAEFNPTKLPEVPRGEGNPNWKPPTAEQKARAAAIMARAAGKVVEPSNYRDTAE